MERERDRKGKECLSFLYAVMSKRSKRNGGDGKVLDVTVT